MITGEGCEAALGATADVLFLNGVLVTQCSVCENLGFTLGKCIFL